MSGVPGGKLRLQLPATSANLGPGFDTAAVALNFYLEVEAETASSFSLTAAGRDALRCGQMEDNLVLDLYCRVLAQNDHPIVPLSIHMQNAIPLGMGCGSSAAGRLAGIAMANHFGGLGWSSRRILAEASALEGHPDNVAACWLGGFVAAAVTGGNVHVACATPPERWRAILVLPTKPLATSHARAVLPESYSRADVVANLQAVGLLCLAFARGQDDLLLAAMGDRIHQPYRAAMCPLLPKLLPLAGTGGILGVALSGAGPAVLVIVDGERHVVDARTVIHDALGDLQTAELLECQFDARGAVIIADPPIAE